MHTEKGTDDCRRHEAARQVLEKSTEAVWQCEAAADEIVEGWHQLVCGRCWISVQGRSCISYYIFHGEGFLEIAYFYLHGSQSCKKGKRLVRSIHREPVCAKLVFKKKSVCPTVNTLQHIQVTLLTLLVPCIFLNKLTQYM